MRKLVLIVCVLLVAACKGGCARRIAGGSKPVEPGVAPPPVTVGPTNAIVDAHPRIWITPTDLPRLRSWANDKNPVWKDGLSKALAQAIEIYDKEFYPGGQPNPKLPDDGIDNWVARNTEAYAELFAFMSLVDPSEAARPKHAERARNLLMHVIREAAKGRAGDKPEPFRGGAFATYNRASAWGEAFGLTVDWIYPSLTAEDKALIRKVFMRWADECVRAATSNEEHPQPIGVVNDSSLLADKKRLRVAANNYYTAHMRQLVLYSLALDDADDPPNDASAPVNKLGNTLRSYLDNAIGAWLYQQYAIYEDAAVAGPALGVKPDGLGPASGGLSPEGFLYGASVGSLHVALLALEKAGHRDPRKYGPQIRMIDSPYWDKVTDSILHSLVAEPALVPKEEYIGPVYQMAAYGDTLRFWLIPDFAALFSSIAIHDAMTGNKARLEKVRWLAINAVEGTAAGLAKRVAGITGNSTITLSLLYFMALDPDLPAPADPRPSMPTVFFDRPLGRLIARTQWGPNGTMFDSKCSWSTIGHQHGDCGEFEMWRKGEWLVKERTGYANDLDVITPEYHNVLAIQNAVSSGAPKPKNLQWFEEGIWTRGGQYGLALNLGDPTVHVSTGTGWAYAQADATNLYNRAGGGGDDATDVTHASRSIAWLQPDFIVVYDRATTKSDKRFKRFHLVTTGDPDVKGQLGTFTTPKGQRLFLQTLLPKTATMTATLAKPFNQIAEGEPSKTKILVEDPAQPKDIRFLHVLQGADAGASPADTSAVQSTSGTAFAGAAVGAFCAVFPVDLAASFTTTTYAVPSRVTAHLVAGLKPGASYDVTTKITGATIEVTVAPGSAYKADDAGVVTIGFAKKP